MEIIISKKQARVPVTIMQVRGKVDSSNYRDFAEVARKVIAEGTEYLLLDLTDCEYMSSAAIRSLNEIFLMFGKSFPSEGRKRGSRSEHLKLFNPSEKIKETLSISGMDAFFEIHTNLVTALASF